MKFWIIKFCLLINILSAQNVVYWEPAIPIPGGDITIYYNMIDGTLPDNTNPVYLHLGYNGWQNTQDYTMSYAPDIGNGWWQYEYEIPEDAETIDFVFTDLQGNWDNNGGMGIDWHINLNYYWMPYYPGPDETVTVILNNVNQTGEIAWTVDAGNGHVPPIESYWPDGSYFDEGLVFSPLLENGPSSLTIDLGQFLSGEQVIHSLKFKIRWENGDWDVGSNGQVLNYDIYIDYNYTPGDPYVFFINPTPNENAQVSGTLNLAVTGDAETVEFWVNGEFLGMDDTVPFEESWTPESSEFGNATIIAIAHGSEGGVSYLFRHVYILYEIMEEPVPPGITDGVNITGNTVTISLYAPYKNFIAVKGSWNQEYPNGELMKISGDTLWWYQTELPDGDYSYQYNVDDEKLIADPWSKDVIWIDPNGGWESGNYSHAVTVFSIGAPEFIWNDSNFSRPPQEDVIVYELHVGDFTSDGETHGTFSDVTEKIQEGYFNDLGINSIELMPVNEFEGSYSWGYNPSFYMAPETSYGTPDELKELVNTAHQHEIAVLLDVVFNHTWGSAPLFQLYQPLDSWDYEDHNYDHCPYFHNQESEWGYKLQHWHEANGREYRAWKYVSDVLFTWVNDYHIDGFRFDHTAGVGWGGDADGASFYADMLNSMDPSIILVAEEDNPGQINSSDFDSGWDYSYHHTVFDNLMEIYVNMYTMRNHLQWWTQNWYTHTAPLNYVESHDESRIIYEATYYQGMNSTEAGLKSKLGAATLLTGTGTPMIYHGQEFGQNGTSRDPGGSIIPQPLQWENLDNNFGSDLYEYYKRLLWLRNNWAVIRGPNLEIIYQDNSQKIIGMNRHDEGLGQTVYCVMNFNNNDQTIPELTFPYGGVWYEFIEDTELESVSGYYADYFISASSARIFTNFKNWSDEGNEEVNVNILSGWNMISLPLEVLNSDYNFVYPDGVEGTLYGFDETYILTEYMVPGNGYWLYFDEGTTSTVTGSSINSVTISLEEGWNLIGGVSSIVPVSSIIDLDEIIVPGTFYEFNGTYVNSTNLEPGKGYWVNIVSSGEITINSDSGNRAKDSQFGYELNANTLQISPVGENHLPQVLYFGTDISEGERQRFSLPPKPPVVSSGKPAKYFDIRFNTDSNLCGSFGEIIVENTSEKLTIDYNIKIEGEEHLNWVLNSDEGNSYVLSGADNITIPSAGKFTLEQNPGIPEKYFLHQNFPNPFNPITTFHYQLPKQSHVNLTLYDLLGREVRQLVNAIQEKGRKSVRWDATDEKGSLVSAGVYLIQLQSGNPIGNSPNDFVQTRKILLIK